MQPKSTGNLLNNTTNSSTQQQQTPCSTNPSQANAAASTTLFQLKPEQFKDLCLRTNGSDELNLMMNDLFHPHKSLDVINKNDVDTLRHYLTGGYSFEAFKNKLKAYDVSSVCGLVWNVNYVAYRCRTCALSPCMSICAECFKAGDHQGHDFNMFRSGAGGACDCGDECVMNPKGFCKSHGNCHLKNKETVLSAPDELTKCCEVIISHLLYRLLQSFRSIYFDNLMTNRINVQTALNELQPYLDLLNELCSFGSSLRKILVDFMINEEFYIKKINSEATCSSNVIVNQSDSRSPTINEENPCAAQTDDNSASEKSNRSYMHTTFLKLFNKQQSETIKLPKQFESNSSEINKLHRRQILDEFLFWCIRFEFPESVVKFLLSLLPDQRYKIVFIKSFISQYSYISVMLLNSKSEHLSSRVVHISVQLFSSETIAIKALDECFLLPIILSTLYNMIAISSQKIKDNQPGQNVNENETNSLLIKSKINGENSRHMVVDPDHPILQDNLYWLVISDLVNLLSHKKIAMSFLNDPTLLDIWFELINYFQAMNLNVRQFGEHIQQEQPTYFSSFSAELEFCSSIMWSFIQHLNAREHVQISKNIINLLMKKLVSWLVDIDMLSLDFDNEEGQSSGFKFIMIQRPNFKLLSFHLPLHRFLASFIYNALFIQEVNLDDLLLKDSSYEMEQMKYATLLAHPLQLQIGFYEIHANMWVRNGMQMKGQAMTYVQNHFCSSFSDSDLFLIQIIANKLDPSRFMDLFFERFHLLAWLKGTIKSNMKLINENKPLKYIVVTNNLQEGNSESVIASVVEEMLDEFNEQLSSRMNNQLQVQIQKLRSADELEPQHQTAMLVGALTLLAQIIITKPNLKLKSYPLTRNEIINLLCISDRTYSQVEENIPDICSLSSAKKYLESILSEVSDFLEPTLDSMSIGNLKQGRYKPKDNIWLNEYDPLYVMLRSVKRREFQESFDRYCQFVERKFFNNRKQKNLWPPFRLPSDDQETTKLNLRWNLLNTKVLHAILLTILYQHFYVQPVTEKILYLVVYILELAVTYQLNKKEDLFEMSDSPKEFDELDYETWFKSNEIGHNLWTPVTFTQVELLTNKTASAASKESPNQHDSTAAEVSNESNNSMNDSTLKTTPPLKKVKSYDENLQPTPTNETRGNFLKVLATESIISVLVKILHSSTMQITDPEIRNEYFNSRTNKFELKFLSKKTGENLSEFNRLGDQNDFILNLLKKASKINTSCHDEIEKTVQQLNFRQSCSTNLNNSYGDSEPSTSYNTNDSSAISSELINNINPSMDDEMKVKKLRAKARQQKLLAQISSSQRAFLSNPNNKMDIEAFQESSLGQSVAATNEDEAKSEKNLQISNSNLNEKQSEGNEEIYDCCICRLSSKATSDRPIGLIALLQSTSVLGHRESKTQTRNVRQKLPLTDEISYKDLQSESVCWRQEEKRVKLMRDAYSLNSCKYSINIGWKGGVYAQMCGHYLHFDCYNSYKQTLDEQLSHMRSNSNLEYTCPLCRQVANCVLPVSVSKLQATLTNSIKIHPEPSTSLAATTPAKIWIMSSLATKKSDSASATSSYEQPISSTLNSIANENSTHQKITDMLKARPFSSHELGSKILTQCKNDALTVITLTTPIEFRYIDHSSTIINPASYGLTSPVDDDIAMFTTSVLRTQLEIDMMLKELYDDNFVISCASFKKKRACFMPLYDVISTHVKLMCNETKPHVKEWIMLTNPKAALDKSEFFRKIDINYDLDQQSEELNEDIADDKNDASTKINTLPEVPLLLRDPISILLLLVVNLPANIEKSIFTSVVNQLYHLVFIQSVIKLCREFDEEDKVLWSRKENNNETKWFTFRDYVSNVINYKDAKFLSKKIQNESKSMDSSTSKLIWTTDNAKEYVDAQSLHFLKIASMLKSYIYNEEIANDQINSFECLLKYLEINLASSIYFSDLQKSTQNGDNASLVEAALIKYSANKQTDIIFSWLNELSPSESNSHVNSLLNLAFDQYHFPQLLDLPHLYSDLFSYYLTKRCEFCGKIPKEVAVCLICGAQICYKTHHCCDQMKDFNKRHINNCGAGTLILININSTYIYVIRGKRCASWASLYLDEHGEEDRDLRRGKPLYLNQQRFNLLKNSWISHTFDYQSLKWFNTSLFIY